MSEKEISDKKSVITNEAIESFLRCRYKSYLKINDTVGYKTEYGLLDDELRDLYKRTIREKFCTQPENQILPTYDFHKRIQIDGVTLTFDYSLRSKHFDISFDALEIHPHESFVTKLAYIPISVSAKEKISKFEKLSIVIRCLILSQLQGGIIPEFSKIVYGRSLKISKIKTETHAKEAKKILDELTKSISSDAPRFYQNTHCKICEFQQICKAKLLEADDLSLLGRMSEKEVLKKNNKGIFSRC